MRPSLWITAATVLPLLSVGLVVVPGRADERWREMLAWAERTEREWTDRDFTREPACGEGTEGSAFAHYQKAVDRAAEFGADDAGLLRDLRLSPGEVPAAARAAFTVRWEPLLRELVAGARCRDARPPVRWQQGFLQSPISLLPARNLVNAAVVESRRLAAAGERGAAVELLLDAATFACDLQQSPTIVEQMVASSLLAIVVIDGCNEDLLGQLDDDVLHVLDRGFARLEARCRRGFDGSGEALLLAHTLQKGAIGQSPPEAGASDVQAGIRHGWSKRWAAADAVMLLAEVCADLRLGADLPWSEREALVARERDRIAGEPSRLLVGWADTLVGGERTLRHVHAHVRLLRMALEFRTTGTATPLGDPLGDGPMRQEARDGGLRVWSAGSTTGQPIERTARRR